MRYRPQFPIYMIAFLLVAVFMALSGLYAHGTADQVTATVVTTERISKGSGDSMSHKYLVFTDGETFENTDSLWYLKFDSSDLHGTMETGETYQIQVYGWRIPFLSMYRNVVSARQVQQ